MPDIRGSWAQAQVTTTKAEIPVIGELVTTTTSFLLTKIERQGSDYELVEEVCSITLTGGSDAVTTIISDEFAKGVSGQRRAIKWFRDGDSLRYEQPKSWRSSGAKLDNVSKSKLPTDTKDPRLTDPDSDGQPGLTVKIRGAIDGELYVVERSWSILKGKMDGRGELHGNIKWHSEQSVIDATSIFLKDPPESTPVKAKRRNYFRMRKLAPDATCKDVEAIGKELLRP